MIHMIYQVATVDDNVIEENQKKPSKKLLENRIHQPLKCSKGIGKAKWHYQVLIMTPMSLEGSFMNIQKIHSHLIVLGLKVNFGENSGAM